MFDLKQLSADPENQKASLTIIHPLTGAPVEDEKGNKLKIILYGPDSSQAKKARRKWANKALQDSRKRRNPNLTMEQLEEKVTDILVACTAGWENLAYEGKPLEFTAENARMIYDKVPVVREQVDEFINDRSNFLGE